MLRKFFKKFKRYNREWDKTLNHIMDNQKIVRVTAYTCGFDGLPKESAIRISNYPNTYGQPVSPVHICIYPSRATKRRLKIMVEREATRTFRGIEND